MIPRPRSLAGQMAVLLAAALLVAQLVNFALILNQRQKLSLAQNEGPAVTRFANIAADVQEAAPEFRAAVLQDSSHRGARLSLEPASGVREAARRADLEAQLRRALAAASVSVRDVRAEDEPVMSGHRGQGAAVIRLAVERPDGQWLVGRMTTPRRDPWLLARLVGATAALYLIVLAAAAWLAARLVRPLRDLAEAAERFGGRGDPPIVKVRGPSDLRRAIDAFNAMNRRLLSLLDEKDRMLGAIGHDLRTPLASLRIRLEDVEPAADREAAIAKIDETSAMLEDILVLARTGRARGESKAVDLSALAETVVEDYAARGDRVEFVPSPRQVAEVAPRLIRRALANLIDNALAYGGSARVSVAAAGGGVEMRVEDEGPGLPPEALEEVLQPFRRLETSRSRMTGGAGLGLAIVQGVAESHHGRLRLENRKTGGLAAVLTVPVGPK